MRKILTITILALLAAGARTLVLADSDWTGNATGDCETTSETIEPFEPWEGHLNTDYPDTGEAIFYGEWGTVDPEKNDIYGSGVAVSNYWDMEGTWDYGDPGTAGGTWEGTFNEGSSQAGGTWDGTWGFVEVCDGYWYDDM